MTAPHIPLGPGTEFDTVRSLLERWGTVAAGVGGDAAVVEMPPGARLAVTNDTSVENVHFRREWLTPAEIGYRACASAISDLAAVAATPLGLVLALTIPEGWRAQIPALADGIGAAARDADVRILGGDLSSGSELSIGVTAFGTVDAELTRAGARPGDTLWVTGRLGGPRLALQALQQGTVPAEEHRARFAHPVPRLREARWLASHGATAAIDISDGLAADAGHVAAASRMRLRLDIDRLPLVSGASSLDAAQGGEEYELLVSAPGSIDAAEFAREFGLPLTPVGSVTLPGGAGPGVDGVSAGSAVQLPHGHDHFA